MAQTVEVIASSSDDDRGPLDRFAAAPGWAFTAAVAALVLATWVAASWPGWWLPLVTPLILGWPTLGLIWIVRLALSARAATWRTPRWLVSPIVVAVGAAVVVAGLPLMLRIRLSEPALSMVARQDIRFDSGWGSKHECHRLFCFEGFSPSYPTNLLPAPPDTGVYFGVHNSARTDALVWHPGGPPSYLPCTVSRFQHVYGPWYVAVAARRSCLI
jgi:hypothetical protein